MPACRTLVIALAALLAAQGCGREPAVRKALDAKAPAALSVDEILGGSSAGYLTATTPRAFVFPADHGPHPGFRNEWWYFTGNLATADGRAFGYQLTFFRNQLAPRAPERTSAWATAEVYMAHFALSDLAGARFHAFERFARAGALGLAGAQSEPFRVWVEGWEARAESGGFAPLALRAAQGGIRLELSLENAGPVVLQGEGGLSRKGPEPGNASYYYSLPRLPSQGTLTIDGQTFAVRGSSWMDREWSTSALSPGTVGWDWLALQLDDGRELMLYRLRRADGSATPESAGMAIAADGGSRALAWEEIELTPAGTWKSPESGVVYPAGFRLRLPGENLDLAITPRLADQELRLAFRYWEGAVEARGTSDGKPLTGRGYLEMTGYR